MHRMLALGAPEYMLKSEDWIPRSLESVFAFFAEPRNLQQITPTWLGFQLVHMEPDAIGEGATITYRLHWCGIPYRWRSRIEEWTPGERFVDVQLNGPYIHWRHVHTFKAERGGVTIGDEVRYGLPFGLLGSLMHSFIVRRQVEGIFEYRRARIAALMSGSPG